MEYVQANKLLDDDNYYKTCINGSCTTDVNQIEGFICTKNENKCLNSDKFNKLIETFENDNKINTLCLKIIKNLKK